MSSTKSKQIDLRNAARDGRINDVRKHLNNDNTVNVNDKDHNGWTALHCACWHGHDDIAELLLDHGADIDATTGAKQTPLLCAWSELSTTKLLLGRGSSVNAVNQNGDTALHIACYCRTGGSIKCAEELLAHGADTSIKNNVGKTPLNLAQDCKHQSIIDLLMKHKKRSEQTTNMGSVQDTMKARNDEMNQTFEKLSNDLESKVETIIDRQCNEMKQSFEELTSQLTLSNAEIVKCVSNLSAIVGHLSSKVYAIEGHRDSNKDGHCEELVCDTIQSLQRVS
jgi:ankyrin repeat protein